ncbi:hypothetical protein FNF28_06079 [Cafeteria roenbergensis]|uniref:Uncharacterized protein n=1 Tax=Cafeteria roenbergensis TaxID=33653 RepID=A0A5A8D228_CAFRO|nr:hypothetical protein FNF28_06079 [Cafeteria roenbergensis]
MKGQQEWFQKLRELYRLDTGGKHAGEQDARASEVWFTPAELFRPHYSRAMAAAVLAMYEHGVAISLQAAAAAPESASPGAVAEGLEAVRGKLQTLLYSEEEQEAPDAGDTTRPLGETATLPALSLGADILKAASKAPAAAATMAQGPSLAVMLPSAALRLVTALHTALPGHGLIAADFHALPLQRGGPTAPAGAAGLVAESSVASTRWYARSDSRSPAAADVPEGFSRVEPHAHHDVACVDVDPPAGTVNPAVVQSRDVDLDGSGPGASAGEEAGRGAAGRGRDHASYLSPHPRGRADIFFATDFAGLAAAWCGGAAGGAAASADVAWQPHLLDATGVADEGRTRSGFNPLLHDYANTSVLLGWPYRA